MAATATARATGWISAGTLAVMMGLAPPALADQTEAQSNQPTQGQTSARQGQQKQAGSGAAAEQPSEQTLQNTWSADRLLSDAAVVGPDGEDIGSVENLLLNQQGQIVALVAQVGGVWDIGDTHIAVPWDEAQRRDGQVQIPVTEDTVDDYSLFKTEYFTKANVGDLQTVEDDLDTGAGIWKATDLLNDYAVLEEGEGYGYVNDLTFDQQGQLQAVVVDATEYVTPGYYAYPWYGYGYAGYAWEPGLGHYTLPYGPNEITEFAAFEYNDLYY